LFILSLIFKVSWVSGSPLEAASSEACTIELRRLLVTTACTSQILTTMVRSMILAAMLIIAASGDLCAQFLKKNQFKAFDFSKTELGMSYAIVGGDEYLMFNAGVPATKLVTVGTRACIRLNRQQISSWSSNYQRIYSSMYYLYGKFETGIDVAQDVRFNVSTTLGAGVADRFDDIPCNWDYAVQPVVLIHPEMNITAALAHNYLASVSFAIMHSPTLEDQNYLSLPKPMLGFNIRCYPWKTL
jgi:hypothetical protein